MRFATVQVDTHIQRGHVIQQYQTQTGIALQLVHRHLEPIHWPSISEVYGGSFEALGGTRRIAGDKGSLHYVVDLDVCYLRSECGRYQVRCRASELGALARAAA